ncbi:cellulose binding domain-containing protein [Streptomyces sp.]|uniref:cellulose binding domain-containing protein n=1 Tax=Streptomyces sp. TaxID=1931 RepID=UPI002D5CD577|nr:cellulose binding domain-containing protein [Streptomyces sp.]HZF91879.1 cellulose binding domain-containing protein [Streptomyces sp.]
MPEPRPSGPGSVAADKLRTPLVAWPAPHWAAARNTPLTASGTAAAPPGCAAIDGWSLVFTPPDGQTVTSGWNADCSPASGRVTARNTSHNATIAPGASVASGFQAAHTGDCAPPSSCTLNGIACAVTGSASK